MLKTWFLIWIICYLKKFLCLKILYNKYALHVPAVYKQSLDFVIIFLCVHKRISYLKKESEKAPNTLSHSNQDFFLLFWTVHAYTNNMVTKIISPLNLTETIVKDKLDIKKHNLTCVSGCWSFFISLFLLFVNY